MKEIKKILQFINAHRDGCVGSMIKSHMKLNEETTIELLKTMINQELISLANIDLSKITDEDLMNSLIIISGGYSDPEYKDIYETNS